VSEEAGQGEIQPFAGPDDAAAAALAILQKDPEFAPAKPRDETGKFTKAPSEEAKPETEAPEEKAEEPVEEEAPKLKFKVKYKGEDDTDVEAELEPDELVKGYMQQKDYSRKTAQLAREREQIEAKIKAAVEPKVSEFEKQLETYRQAVLMLADREGANVDLNKLAETDPAQAQKLFFKRLEFNNTLQAITGKQQELLTQRQEEMRATLQKQAKEAVEALERDIPGWNQDRYSKVLKTGMEYGFKAEEVNSITDPRAIKVLDDARQWREFKAAKPATQDKQKVTVPKVVKPGTAEKPDPKATEWKDTMGRLQKSGGKDLGAAASLAMRILEREGVK